MKNKHFRAVGLVGVEPTTSRLSDSLSSRRMSSVPLLLIDVAKRPSVVVVGGRGFNGGTRRSKTEHALARLGAYEGGPSSLVDIGGAA